MKNERHPTVEQLLQAEAAILKRQGPTYQTELPTPVAPIRHKVGDMPSNPVILPTEEEMELLTISHLDYTELAKQTLFFNGATYYDTYSFPTMKEAIIQLNDWMTRQIQYISKEMQQLLKVHSGSLHDVEGISIPLEYRWSRDRIALTNLTYVSVDFIRDDWGSVINMIMRYKSGEADYYAEGLMLFVEGRQYIRVNLLKKAKQADEWDWN